MRERVLGAKLDAMHVRTNERTYGRELTLGSLLTKRFARERSKMSTQPDDFRNDRPSFAGAGLDFGERADRIRGGRREPISQLVRQLVYRRDNWRCLHCGAMANARDPHRRSGALHLDHIVPWSAGGSDRSDNLRTLCAPCNYSRSNRVTGKEAPVLPIVRICLPCLTYSFERQSNAFDVYCGSRSHESWAIPGWQIL